MNQYQQQENQERRSRNSGPSSGPSRPRICPSCGAQYEPGDAFCSECGEPLNQGAPAAVQQQEQQQANTATRQQPRTGRGRECPHCHKPINDTCELCPHCGKPVSDDHCTFCGAAFEGNEPFCAECGSPRAGIRCPQCGTISYRSFCCHCNAPLNDNALAALEEARRDPKFQRVQQLSQEMAEMEDYLEMVREEIEAAIAEAEMEGDGPGAPGLSDEGRQLQEKYAELMKLMGQVVAPPSQKPKERPSVKRREQLKKKYFNAEEVMEAYQQKAAEMQETLAAMIPDVSMTPQQQRDYACSRKIAVDSCVKKRVPTCWVCNLCGCQHGQPSECAEPELGGKWIYKTVIVNERVWKYLD